MHVMTTITGASVALAGQNVCPRLLVEKLAHSNQQLVTPPNKFLRRDAETTRSRRERKSDPERRDQHHRRENEADDAA